MIRTSSMAKISLAFTAAATDDDDDDAIIHTMRAACTSDQRRRRLVVAPLRAPNHLAHDLISGDLLALGVWRIVWRYVSELVSK